MALREIPAWGLDAGNPPLFYVVAGGQLRASVSASFFFFLKRPETLIRLTSATHEQSLS